MIVTLIEKIYSFLWGDLVQIPLPGGSSLGSQHHLRFDVPLWTGAGTLLRPRRFHGDL